jgi:PhoPQ-activated pathogenicity-related protein
MNKYDPNKLSRILVALAVCCIICPRATAKETALDRYVAKPDPAYEYSVVSTIEGKRSTTYILSMTSQQFLTKADVDRTLWKHWIVIVKPHRIKHETSLIVIGGGSNGKEPPKKAEDYMSQIAIKTGSVVTGLGMIPNQPLRFAGDTRDRYEDALIAYTWDKYLRTGDERWPARLPMTKAVVRAMDTVTDFLSKPEGGKVVVDKFVAAGASKRGWTTWSVAAVDKRIVAIVPIVIDMLNVVPSFKHHYRAYGFYAPAVGDYTEMGIMGWQDTPEYERLLKIIEPYEYLDRYTMPKYLINATGDQFFLPDSWKFYYKNLIGQKHLRYVPNAGHSLDGGMDAVYSLAAYYNAILNQTKLPEYDWAVQEDGSIKVTTKVRPKKVLLWQCTNPETRDFRIETTGKTWTSSRLRPVSRGTYVGKVSTPDKGWTAFLVELTYAEQIQRGSSTRRGGRLGQATGRVGAPFKFTTGVNILPEAMPFEFKPMPIPKR